MPPEGDPEEREDMPASEERPGEGLENGLHPRAVRGPTARRPRAPFAKAATVLATLGAAFVLLSAGVCASGGGLEGLMPLVPGVLLLVLAGAVGVVAGLIARGVLSLRGGRYAIITILALLVLAVLGLNNGVSIGPSAWYSELWLLPAAGALVLFVVALAAEQQGARGALRGVLVGTGLGLLAPLLALALFYLFINLYRAIAGPL